MFHVGLPCYLELNSGWSVSINANKTRTHFSRNIHMARACFPNVQFPVSHTGNIVSSISFCFQDANYAYATRRGILKRIRACEHLQKICEHQQASTHLILGAIRAKAKFASTFKLNGTIRYPYCAFLEKKKKTIEFAAGLPRAVFC